ncbi:MAG: PP2C family protein-serine/threonine phosphatase [Ignavibacteria bacterium]|nr:PP2C family protein-serine/threonine phosphatase [Ignavibacteria bacterium]
MNIFEKIYNLYTSDLTSDEFEKLVTKDVPGLYKFYSRDMKKPDESQDKFKRWLLFVRNFIVALLRKLTPLRRLLFSIAIFIYAAGFITDNPQWYSTSIVILTFLVILEVADKIIAKDEISIAREVQDSMIPKSAPNYEGYDIDCYCETATDVGGDFIDFVNRQDKLLITVGDISGKGMGAALHMVHVRAIIRYVADIISEPVDIMKTLNRDIIKNFKKGLFLTAVLAEIDKGKIKLCRGGHPPIMYYKKSENRCEELKPAGSALGMMNEELFNKTIQSIDIEPQSGDVVFIYTDGIFEAMNSNKDEYGLAKVKEVLGTNAYKDAADIKRILIDSVNNFRGMNEVNDDITFAVIKKK